MQTKEEQAKEDERIGLLFAIFNVPNPHLRVMELKILPALTLKELVCFSQINKMPWSKRMRDEIKRRKQCVTIYTWSEDEIPSESYWDQGTGVRARFGHSALQTFGTLKAEAGIYVSFYPGECHRNHHTPTCKKSNSHFHRWNEEMSEEVKKMAKAVDLYGLDVDAIHTAFHEMHDGQMNSKKNWDPRYNCSDVVLLLLEKGKLFEKSISPFGWKTISVIGVTSGVLGFRVCVIWLDSIFFRSNYIISGKRQLIPSRSSFYPNDYYLGYPSYFFNWPEANLFIGVFSASIMYLYAMTSYSKSCFPVRSYHQTCLSSASQAGIIGFLSPFGEIFLVRNFPMIKNNIHFINSITNTLDIIINNDWVISLGQVLLDKSKYTLNKWCLLFLLGFIPPTIALAFI